MSEAFPFTIPSSTAAGPSTSAKPSYGFKPPTQPRPRNGFVDAVRLKMAGIAPPSSARPDINLHAIAANLRTASEADLRELREAVQRRQVVENMMELGGVYFPGLEKITELNKEPDTAATLKARVADLQDKHTGDVGQLYQWHAEDYYDHVLDLTRSKPDHDDPAVEAFYKNSRSAFDSANEFDNELDAHYHAYGRAVLPLQKQLRGLQAQDDAEQRRRDAQFPQDKTSFQAITNKDTKLRIAQFLVADELARERMRDQYSWPWRTTLNLTTEFNTNKVFHDEVKDFVSSMKSQDPRVRPAVQ